MGLKIVIQDEVVWEADDDTRVRRVGLVSVGGEKGAALIQPNQESIEITIEALPQHSVTTNDDHAYPKNIAGEGVDGGGDHDPEHDTQPGMAGVTAQGSGGAVTEASVAPSDDPANNNGSDNLGGDGPGDDSEDVTPDEQADTDGAGEDDVDGDVTL